MPSRDPLVFESGEKVDFFKGDWRATSPEGFRVFGEEVARLEEAVRDALSVLNEHLDSTCLVCGEQVLAYESDTLVVKLATGMPNVVHSRCDSGVRRPGWRYTERHCVGGREEEDEGSGEVYDV